MNAGGRYRANIIVTQVHHALSELVCVCVVCVGSSATRELVGDGKRETNNKHHPSFIPHLQPTQGSNMSQGVHAAIVKLFEFLQEQLSDRSWKLLRVSMG